MKTMLPSHQNTRSTPTTCGALVIGACSPALRQASRTELTDFGVGKPLLQFLFNHPHAGIASPWHKAMHFPGSRCMSHLKAIFSSLDWWRLYPCPDLLSNQPGRNFPTRFISSACSKTRDLAMIYSPEGGSIELNAGFLKHDVSVQCFNPENGALLWQRSFGATCNRIDAGGPGDRLLILRQS
jgi:hypothetical protein